MTSETRLSLLYPASYAHEKESRPVADVSVIAALSAEPLFYAMHRQSRFKPNQQHPIVYSTDDIDVIRYRLDVVEDLLNHDGLCKLLETLLPDLEDLRELHSAPFEQPRDMFDYFSSITEIELYIALMDKLHRFFVQERSAFHSEAIQALAAETKRMCEDESYARLKTEYAKMSQSIRSIKSVTIGVNLDAALKPAEAGIVSVHTEPFRSGHIIDKLLRADFSDDGYNCLAPLEVVGKGLAPDEAARFRAAVASTLHTVLKSSLKSWKPVVRSFTGSSTKFPVRLSDEIRFLLGGVALLRKLLEAGVPICKPEVEPQGAKAFAVNGLYNPVTALNLHAENEAGGRIVLNQMQFDENGMIYILTGPNQGGKTVFVQAVGIAQLMFQLGLFVPAFSASISPVDRIYTHFPEERERYANGRFADECRRLTEICDKLTEHSLLLMDETFSSTSASEATYIAEQVLLGLRAAGCRVLFATHLHDLARSIDHLNARSEPERGRIDSLTAEIEDEDFMATRSYKISRSRPQGRSYARDIAEKYGLTFERLIRSVGKPKEREREIGGAGADEG